MQYKLLKFSLKNIYKVGGLFALLFYYSLLYGNSINFTYVYPPDLIINLNPDHPAGKAYIYWEAPADGKYTLTYNYQEEKTALKEISCSQGEEVKFFITSNSITTAAGQRAILDLPDGTYTFNLQVTSTSNGKTYSAGFTITVDGTPPHTPSGVKAIPGDGGVKLKWNPPIDKDIEAYFIYYSTYPDVVEQLQQNSPSVVTTKAAGNVNEYYLDNLKNETEYHFVIRAKDYAENYSDYSEEVTATPRETYSLADLTGEEGGCFIATATYGNINNPVVITYRLFRDNFLTRFKTGRKFIRLYYKLSPEYVPYLHNYPLLKVVSFILLTILALIIAIPVLIALNPAITLPSFLILFSLLTGGGKKN